MKKEKSRLYKQYVSSGQAGNTNIDEGRLVEVEKILDNHMPENRNSKIIDVGCGYGIYLKELKERGYKNVKGVDISSEQVKAARENGLEEVYEGEAVKFLKEEERESVDVILMIDIIEHMTMEETFSVLEEAHRILKKRGKCIIHVPNAQGLFGMRIRYGDLTHERAFSPKSLQQLLRSTGFTYIEIFEDKPIVHGVWSLVRRILWEIITLLPKLVLLIESPGAISFALSQNILLTSIKENGKYKGAEK